MNIRLDSVLNRAQAGMALAHRVLEALSGSDCMVCLDFADVYRMNPSFANAFVMTLLHERSVENIHDRVRVINRSDQVAQAMEESERRFARGVRLTTQQTKTPA